MTEGRKIYTSGLHHRLIDMTIVASGSDGDVEIKEIKLGCIGEETIDIPPKLREYQKMISSFLDGEKVDLTVIPVNMGNYTDFQRAVFCVAKKIKRGETLCYEELASTAGFPGAFRAAGSVMRKNRCPLIIPCHRVVLKNGNAGSYCGDTTGKLAMFKREILKMEGK